MTGCATNWNMEQKKDLINIYNLYLNNFLVWYIINEIQYKENSFWPYTL
jgi:hypothetical protein